MITIEELKKTAKLAKLNFSDDQMQEVEHKINAVMQMIDSLKEVDCTNVEPLRSVCEMDQRMREDEVTIENISDELFSCVPEKGSELAKQVKCYTVPKVVE